jgi:nitrate reductase beta subunit
MWWNNVETKPYGGYPQHWDVKILKLLSDAHQKQQKKMVWDTSKKSDTAPYGVYDGMTIFEAAEGKDKVALGYEPTETEWLFPNMYEDVPYSKEEGFQKEATMPEHRVWFFYLQRICNHCTYPACLASCPERAIYKRKEDGIVLIDQQRCKGVRKCVEACPYKKPMHRSVTKTTEKCIACYPRIEGKDPLTEGEPMETVCMVSCVGKIRLQSLVELDKNGDWKNNPSNPIYYMVRVEKVALPLYPQFGTSPNVYYIPPRWVPKEYLRQMFGPGVDHAIEQYSYPSRTLMAILQLFRASKKIIFKYEIIEGKEIFKTTINGKPWSVYNDTVIGYSKSGKEVVRTQVEEPFFIRDEKHYNSI